MSNDNPTPPNHHNPDQTSNTTNSNNKTQPQKNSTAQNQTQESSFLHKIQSSATGLLRDTITNPNAHALGSDLGQLHSGAVNGKGSSSSSSSSSRWAGVNGSQQYDSAPAGLSSSSSSRIGTAEAFRSASASQQNHTLFEPQSFNQEEYFQNDYYNYNDEYTQTKGKEKEKPSTFYPPSIPMDPSSSFDEYYEAAWIRHTQHSNNNNNQNHDDTHKQTPQQEQIPIDQDGAAVISLLSDPSFQPGFPDDNDNEHYLYEHTTTPAPLTADEIRILETFRRQQHLSTDPQTKTNTITPHSLIPDIDTFLAENDGSSIRGEGISDAALRDAVLRNLPGAEDWVAVNDRYQDEVWGYLRPALEAASKEIEENERESEPAREGPAVRRLKMILRHLQL